MRAARFYLPVTLWLWLMLLSSHRCPVLTVKQFVVNLCVQSIPLVCDFSVRQRFLHTFTEFKSVFCFFCFSLFFFFTLMNQAPLVLANRDNMKVCCSFR